MIKDSGTRQEFDSGAVRDIQEGKGRCDLLPLDVVAEYYYRAFGEEDSAWRTITPISKFVKTGESHWLMLALVAFVDESDFTSHSDMFLAVSKHFEEGAKKYGENNWQKGLPVRCYINSAIRHYLKWLRGDTDEPHDRAFVWNIMCCMWTCQNKPELNDYRKEHKNESNFSPSNRETD